MTPTLPEGDNPYAWTAETAAAEETKHYRELWEQEKARREAAEQARDEARRLAALERTNAAEAHAETQRQPADAQAKLAACMEVEERWHRCELNHPGDLMRAIAAALHDKPQG